MNRATLFIILTLLALLHGWLTGFSFMDMGAIAFYEASGKGYFALPNRFLTHLILLPFSLFYKMSASFSFLKWVFTLSYAILPLATLFLLWRKKASLLHYTTLLFIISHTVPTSQRIVTGILFLSLTFIRKSELKTGLRFVSAFIHPFSVFYLFNDLVQDFRTKKAKWILASIVIAIVATLLIHFHLDSDYNKTRLGMSHLERYPLQIIFYLLYGAFLFVSKDKLKQYFFVFLSLISLNFILCLSQGASTIGEFSYIMKYSTLLATLVFIRALNNQIEIGKNILLLFTFVILLIPHKLIRDQYTQTLRLVSFLKSQDKKCIPLKNIPDKINKPVIFEDDYSILYFYSYMTPIEQILEIQGQDLRCAQFDQESSYQLPQFYPHMPRVPENKFFNYNP
jgi:hypothetical protein